MPRVMNRHHGTVSGHAKSVMRPGPFGNPFVIGWDGDRATVIAKHAAWIMEPAQAQLRTKIRVELQGYDLICCCAPLSCHADILLQIANSEEAPCTTQE